MARPWLVRAPALAECRSLIIFGFALIVLALGAVLSPATGFASSAYFNVVKDNTGLEAYWRLGEPTGVGTAVDGADEQPTAGRSQRRHLSRHSSARTGRGDHRRWQRRRGPEHRRRQRRLSRQRLTGSRMTGRSRWRPGSSAAGPHTPGFEAIISKGQDAYGLFLLNDRVVLRKPGPSGVNMQRRSFRSWTPRRGITWLRPRPRWGRRSTSTAWTGRRCR